MAGEILESTVRASLLSNPTAADVDVFRSVTSALSRSAQSQLTLAEESDRRLKPVLQSLVEVTTAWKAGRREELSALQRSLDSRVSALESSGAETALGRLREFCAALEAVDGSSLGRPRLPTNVEAVLQSLPFRVRRSCSSTARRPLHLEEFAFLTAAVERSVVAAVGFCRSGDTDKDAAFLNAVGSLLGTFCRLGKCVDLDVAGTFSLLATEILLKPLAFHFNPDRQTFSVHHPERYVEYAISQTVSSLVSVLRSVESDPVRCEGCVGLVSRAIAAQFNGLYLDQVAHDGPTFFHVVNTCFDGMHRWEGQVLRALQLPASPVLSPFASVLLIERVRGRWLGLERAYLEDFLPLRTAEGMSGGSWRQKEIALRLRSHPVSVVSRFALVPTKLRGAVTAIAGTLSRFDPLLRLLEKTELAKPFADDVYEGLVGPMLDSWTTHVESRTAIVTSKLVEGVNGSFASLVEDLVSLDASAEHLRRTIELWVDVFPDIGGAVAAVLDRLQLLSSRQLRCYVEFAERLLLGLAGPPSPGGRTAEPSEMLCDLEVLVRTVARLSSDRDRDIITEGIGSALRESAAAYSEVALARLLQSLNCASTLELLAHVSPSPS